MCFQGPYKAGPGPRPKGLRTHDTRSARKNTFFHLKIWFFKLNNTFFESDRLAALHTPTHTNTTHTHTHKHTYIQMHTHRCTHTYCINIHTQTNTTHTETHTSHIPRTTHTHTLTHLCIPVPKYRKLGLRRDAVFPTFSDLPTFFFFFLFFLLPVHVHVLYCVTTMRVNWWLSGQFWLRKSSSFKGASPPSTPTRVLPLDPARGSAPRPPVPGYFPTFFNSPSGIPAYVLKERKKKKKAPYMYFNS